MQLKTYKALRPNGEHVDIKIDLTDPLNVLYLYDVGGLMEFVVKHNEEFVKISGTYGEFEQEIEKLLSITGKKFYDKRNISSQFS